MGQLGCEGTLSVGGRTLPAPCPAPCAAPWCRLTKVKIVHAVGHENVVEHDQALAVRLGKHVHAPVGPRHVLAHAGGEKG